MAATPIRFRCWLSLLAFAGLSFTRTHAAPNFSNNIKFSNGSSPALTGNRFDVLPSSGQKTGSNLFHSFSDFGVATGYSAVFKTPTDVNNVIARVTGGNPSGIDGTLRTEMENSADLSGANLYFINPSGVVFGPNAKLEVGGSFTASTADYVKLKDGGRFDARNPANDVLTTAPVSAFGFLGPQATAAVKVTGASLAAAPGKTLSFIGGDFVVDGGSLTAPGGRVSIFSTHSAGEWRVDERSSTPFSSLGDVTLLNGANIDVSGPSGGGLLVQGEHVSLSQTTIHADTQGIGMGEGVAVEARQTSTFDSSTVTSRAVTTTPAGAQAGGIVITAGALTATGNTVFSASTQGAGGAGSVKLTIAGTLDLEGGSGFYANSTPGATGAAGLIALTAQRVQMVSGTLAADSAGAPTAGTVQVVSGAVSLSSGSSLEAAGTGIGSAGLVDVRTNDLQMRGGSQILTDSSASGAPGKISITVLDPDAPASVLLDGYDPATQTVAATFINSRPLAGTADSGRGRISIETGTLTLMNGGSISGEAFGLGAASNVTVTAADVQITNTAPLPTPFTGISVDTVSSGAGGTILLQSSGKIELSSGGRLTASTFGNGPAGEVHLAAPAISITGASLIDSVAAGNGSAGFVQLRTNDLRLESGGRITIFSSGTGAPGRIEISRLDPDSPSSVLISAYDPVTQTRPLTGLVAQSLAMASNVTRSLISIETDALTLRDGGVVTSDSYGLGLGGDINVSAKTVLITNATNSAAFVTGVTAGTQGVGSAGSGGTITITATESIQLSNGGRIYASGLGDGAAGVVHLSSSVISLSGSSKTDAVTKGNGDAGIIELRTNDLRLESGATITANTSGAGASGKILVTPLHSDAPSSVLVSGYDPITQTDSLTFLTSQSEKTATNKVGGLIHIETDTLTVMNGGDIGGDTFGAGKGSDITILAHDINLTRLETKLTPFTGISASTQGSAKAGQGGSIDLQATGAFTMTNSVRVYNQTTGDGQAGNIHISAGLLRLNNADISCEATADGTAGNLTIDHTGNIFLEDNGRLYTKSAGKNAPGITTIDAINLTMTGGTIDNSASQGRGDSFTGLNLTLSGTLSMDAKATIQSSISGEMHGASIKIHAATINLTGGTIKADANGDGFGGNIDIHATGALSLTDEAHVSSNSSSLGAGAKGGTVQLYGSSITIADSSVTSDAFLGGTAGKVLIRGGTLFAQHGAEISSESHGDARAGSIDVNVAKIIGDGATLSTSNGFEGNLPSGDISLVATGAIVLNNCTLSSDTNNTGKAGSITVSGRNVTVAQCELESGTGADGGKSGAAGMIRLSAVENLIVRGGQIEGSSFGTGAAGGIQFDGNVVRIEDRALIESSAFGTGAGGDIVINGRKSVTLAAFINATSFGDGLGRASGASGDIRVYGPQIAVEGGFLDVSSLSVDRFGTGGTGNIVLAGLNGTRAASILIDHSILQTSRTNSSEADPTKGGRSGNVNLNAGQIVIRDSSLSAEATYARFGGTISLAGGAVTIARSSLSASIRNGPAMGQGGAVVVRADQLSLDRKSSLEAETFGLARGGDIDLELSGRFLDEGGRISAATFGRSDDFAPGTAVASGPGGQITISAGNITLWSRANISANTNGSGVGGGVSLTAPEITIASGSTVSAGSLALGRGGGVTLRGEHILLEDSTVAVRATLGDAGDITISGGELLLRGGTLAAEANQSGGNISLSVRRLLLAPGQISANAVNGDGGRISLEIPADGVFGDSHDFVVASPFITQSPDSRISASSTFGVQGTLFISAPFVDLAGSLEGLEVSFADASTQLRDHCARKLQREFSSYLRLGRGGQQAQPEEPAASF